MLQYRPQSRWRLAPSSSPSSVGLSNMPTGPAADDEEGGRGLEELRDGGLGVSGGAEGFGGCLYQSVTG